MRSTAERREAGRKVGGRGLTARESLSERLQRAKPASVSLAGKGERHVRTEVGREVCEDRGRVRGM